MKNIESLHNHTKISDGDLSHKEVLSLAQKLGYKTLAFTDHDVLPSDKTLTFLKKYKGPVNVVMGIEISAKHPKEALRGNGTLHVIGLFVDPQNKKLRAFTKKIARLRITRMKKTVLNLQKYGLSITAEECLRKAGEGTVNKPHIVSVLLSKKKNLLIFKKSIEEMKEASKTNDKIKKEYELMMNVGEYQYPYSLFLGHHAFKPCSVEIDDRPDLDEAVKLIRNAHGLAFIAHYFTTANEIPLKLVEKLLKQKRIDGLETTYGLGFKGKFKKKIKEEQEILKGLIKKYKALESGGGDSHTKKDYELYASKKSNHENVRGKIELISERLNLK
jgi:predicted metal-dependent phosphoesterase TrpH